MEEKDKVENKVEENNQKQSVTGGGDENDEISHDETADDNLKEENSQEEISDMENPEENPEQKEDTELESATEEVEEEMKEEETEEKEEEQVMEKETEIEEKQERESVEDNLEKEMEGKDIDTGSGESEEAQEAEIKTETEPVEESEEKETIDIEDERYRWYAVRIISGHENKVKAYLDSEIRTEGYDDRIKNVLIPLEKVFEVKGGKKKVKYKNFLPGYILIQADLDDKIRNFISQAPSIINMVGAKSVQGAKLDPVPLKKSEVKRIAALLSEESETEKIDLHLNVGDPVKVTSGPFNNFSGNVLEINTEKMKVKVMVSIFGRKTPIELEFTQIEKEK